MKNTLYYKFDKQSIYLSITLISIFFWITGCADLKIIVELKAADL